MKWRGLRQDQRSVSEIYGTVLIISLAFTTALLLIGGGYVIVDQLQTEAQDSLAQDNVESIDQGIDDLAGTTSNETRTFEIPEETGSDYSADESDGEFLINVTTDSSYWDRTVAETDPSISNGDGKDIVLGTIRHEADDGTVTAYQGGGLWRRPRASGATFVESSPNLDFTGDNINLGIVNLTSVDEISEGSEITAQRNADSQSSERLQRFMAQFWTDRYNPAVTAPVEINLTITSEYADGWATYAEESLTADRSEYTVLYPYNGNDNQVKILFGQIGEGIDANNEPVFGDEDILYSGSSDWAYAYQNESSAHGRLKDDPSEQWAYRPTLDMSGALSGGDEYEVAVYNETGRWLIFNNSRGSGPTDGAWETADGTVVETAELQGASNEVFNTSGAPPSGQNATDLTGNGHNFFIDPPGNLSTAGAAPMCVVTNSSGDANVRQHIDDPDDGCLENMVGLEEDLIDPIPELAEFNVSIHPTETTPAQRYEDGDFKIDVNITNEGTGVGERPLGVYILNETAYPDPTQAILANSTQASDLRLTPGQRVEKTYTVDLKQDWQLPRGERDYMVFATTGTSSDELIEQSTGNPDYFTVLERPSNFQVEEESDIDVSNTVEQGEAVEIDVRVNDTAQERNDVETQIVRLRRGDGTPINRTRVTIKTDSEYGSDDWDETVTMIWYVDDDAPTGDVTIEAQTTDMTSPQTKTVTVQEVPEQEPAFDVGTLDIDDGVDAGETVEVEADIENVGTDSGETLVRLENQTTGEVYALEQTPEINQGDSETVTLEWETSADDPTNGPVQAAVVADGNQTTGEINLEDPNTESQFDIEITGTNSPVAVGDGPLQVDVSIENTGDGADTQLVYLDASNFSAPDVGYTEVSLNPGDSTTETLEWTPGPNNNGTADIVAKTDDDSGTEEVSVTLPANTDAEYEVNFESDDYSVAAGGQLQTNINVENVGDAAGSQYVYLTDFNGNTVATQEVDLDPGNSDSITLTWDTSQADVGNGTLNVYSNDDDGSASGEVIGPESTDAEYNVEFVEDSYTVTAGGELQTNITVTNDGDGSGEQYIYLTDLNGTVVETQQVSLDSGNSQTISLSWQTAVADGPASGTISAGSDDDTADAQANLILDQSATDFSVEFTESDYSLPAGQNLPVEVEVTNANDADTGKEVVVLKDPDENIVDSVEVGPLDPGESTTVEFWWNTSVSDGPASGDEVTKTLTTSADNSDDTADVTLISPSADRSQFDVDIVSGSTNDPITEGENLTVSATITNNGEALDEQDIVLENFRGGPIDVVENVSLSPEDSTTVDFTWQTVTGTIEGLDGSTEQVTDDITVRSEDDSAAASVTIEKNVTTRDPIDVVFVLDETGSMGQPGDGQGDDDYAYRFGWGNPDETIDVSDIEGETVDDGEIWVAVDYIEDKEFNCGWFGCDEEDVYEPISDDTTNNDLYPSAYAPHYEWYEGETIDSVPTEVENNADFIAVYDSGNGQDPLGTRMTATRIGIGQLSSDVGDNVGIVQYDEEGVTTQSMTGNLDGANESLSRYVGSATSIVSGIEAGVSLVESGDNEKKYVILLTDGGQTVNEDGYEYNDISDYCNYYSRNPSRCAEMVEDQADEIPSDIRFDTVGFGGYDNSQEDEDALEYVANEEGVRSSSAPEGQLWDGSDPSDLKNIFPDIVGDAAEPDVPDFQITSVDPSTGSIPAGDTLSVEVTVENRGEDDGEQFVSLQAGDAVVDSQRVEILQGESETIDLTWETTGASPGDEVTLTVRTLDDTNDDETVLIESRNPDSSQFDVSINTQPPTEVAVGDDVTIQASVENNGGISDTQEIALYVDGTDDFTGTTQTVSLDSGDSTTVDLTWTAGPDYTGERTLVAKSEDDSAETEEFVVEGGSSDAPFEVSIQGADEQPVQEGEELILDVEVENTGDKTDTQTVHLLDGDSGGVVDFVEGVELDEDETTTIQLSWQTQVGDASNIGEKTLTADTSADEDSVTANVTAIEDDQPDFLVDNVNLDPNPVEEGNELSVTAEITNDGSEQSQQEVRLVEADASLGGIIDTTEVDLDADETDTVTLTWQTEIGDGGVEQPLSVETTADTANATANVTEQEVDQPLFNVSFDEPDTVEVSAGETASLDVTVTNEGESDGDQTISLFNGDSGNLVDVVDVSLSPGDSTTKTLEWDTTQDNVGEVELRAESNQDDDSVTVDVQGDDNVTNFEVNINEGQTDQSGDVDEQLEVNVTVENTGEDFGAQDIVVVNDTSGTPITFEDDLSLDSGEESTFSIPWTPDEAGQYDLVAESEDTTSDPVTVDVASTNTNAVVEIDSISYTDEVEAGKEASVEVEVKTQDDTPANGAVVWMEIFDNDDERVKEVFDDGVNIPATGTKTVTLTWVTESSDVGEYNFSVKTNDDENPDNELTLTPPRPFDVSASVVDEPVTAGEDPVEVEITVENNGDIPRDPTAQLNYSASNFIVDMSSMGEIQPGDEETVTLTWNTLPGDGNDDSEQTLKAQLANFPSEDTVSVQIDEADTNLDPESRPGMGNPLDIDLSEIEIGS